LESGTAGPGAAKRQLRENFTVDGLVEDSVHIGDRFTVGSAQVVVRQPRLPCYKLGLRFETNVMVKRFLASGRTGFYLRSSVKAMSARERRW
jgi:MOSC domain-containing protein YiiM